MKTTRLLILFLFTMSSVYAQDTTKVWTLEECITHAWRNNIQVRQSELTVLNSQQLLKQAEWARVPNLNAQVNARNSVGRAVDPFTNVIVNQDYTTQNYSLNSNVTLFNGLNQHYTVKQNKSNVDKSEFDLENQKNITALSIANQYLNILLAQEQVKNAQLSLTTSKLQAERTEKQVNAGAFPKQNLLQANQQVANDEVNLITAENSLDLARLVLRQALQLPSSERMQVEVPVISDPNLTAIDITLEEVFQSALSLPEVKSAQSQVEASQYGLAVARSFYYPTLSLSGGLNTNWSSNAPDQIGGRENTYSNQLDFNLARSVGLTLNIPIFNRLQANVGVNRAKITLQNSEYGLTNVKNQLRQNIEQAYYNARAAAKTYQATKNQLDALEESFRNVEQRFNLGATNSVEYNQIKNDFNKSQNDLVRTKYDFIFKLKVLDFYQGKPLQL
ncbi:MAG TPA: TolC family protein [Cyclobacteriaceae bacterium]|nr:TolC family protein [Cyclobacteriaceae bacterium]